MIPSQEKAWLAASRKAAYYWAKGNEKKALKIFYDASSMEIKWSKKNKWRGRT